MLKRKAGFDEGRKQYSVKRRKSVQEETEVETINREPRTVKDIHQLLDFSQDSIAKVSTNIKVFQSFVESIKTCYDPGTKSLKRKALLDYVQSIQPESDDGIFQTSPTLVQIWKYAVKSEHYGLQVLIPSTLAAILSEIANDLEFENPGLQLCRLLLKKDQIPLISQIFTAGHRIPAYVSAVLRLLTVVVSFSGGSCAQAVYGQFPQAFEHLSGFLTIKESQRSPETCGNTILLKCTVLRFILVNLQFQSSNVKAEILSRPRLAQTLFANLKYQPVRLIIEILGGFRRFFITDTNISRYTKRLVLTEDILKHLSSLYQHPAGSGDNDSRGVPEAAHEILTLLCTSESIGILVGQNAWYPSCDTEDAGSDTKSASKVSYTMDLTPRKVFISRVPVRNTLLASFLQSLRPFANRFECELTIAIFTAAPELVADYFLRKNDFSFDPKLTSTWVGYSAFIHSVIKLGLPSSHFSKPIGKVSPPPVSVVIESIIPQPMNRKMLTRCLNQKTLLLKVLALKLMRASFSKLEQVRSLVRGGSHSWHNFETKLIDKFIQRCPEPQHLVAMYRRSSENDKIIMEMITGVLSMYFKCVPPLAVMYTIDISTALVQTLQEDDLRNTVQQAPLCGRANLMNLLTIACYSPNMRWWYRPDGMTISPFTAILRFYVTRMRTEPAYIKGLLESILFDACILQPITERSAATALLESLSEGHGWTPTLDLWCFLDDCITRLVRKSLKFSGDLCSYFASISSSSISSCEKKISLLILFLREQWKFFEQKMLRASQISNVVAWIERYLQASIEIGEDQALIKEVRNSLRDHRRYNIINVSPRSVKETAFVSVPKGLIQDPPDSALKKLPNLVNVSQLKIVDKLLEPPAEPIKSSGIYKCLRKDPQEAVEDGSFGELVMCLCADLDNTRRQALCNLGLFASRLETSGYREWRQLHLLTGELLETAQDTVLKAPIPSFVAVIASQGASVLSNPLHVMYSEVNKWLNSGPAWDYLNLPHQWIERVLSQAPETNGSYWTGCEWLIDALFEGLLTDYDIDLYLRCGVFEQLLSLSSSLICPGQINDKILRLIYRALFFGKERTLVTRVGIMGWIGSRSCIQGCDMALVKLLSSRIEQGCGDTTNQEWGAALRKSQSDQ